MCYAAPIAGAIITTFLNNSRKSVKLWWLSLMFYGGALFGIIDHVWAGELLVVPENLAGDIALGVVISISTVLMWAFLIKLHPVKE